MAMEVQLQGGSWAANRVALSFIDSKIVVDNDLAGMAVQKHPDDLKLGAPAPLNRYILKPLVRATNLNKVNCI